MAPLLVSRADYAEDQRYPYAILTTHVLHRGLQTGAGIGFAIAVGNAALRAQRGALSPRPGLLLASAGRGAVYGMVLSGLALASRMRGRSAIEWADRSWRLLGNRGQVLTDGWSGVGSAAGLVLALAGGRQAAAAAPGAGKTALRLLGGTAAGNLAGVCGYMVYHHAILRDID